MSHNVRDWIEIRREYLRQLAELEARLAASAANSDQVQRLAELGNVTDRGSTITKERTMGVWIAGHNMPGYLPESEPAGFETFADAKQYMIDVLDKNGDFAFDYGDKDEADQLSAEMEDLNLASQGEWGTIVGNTSYWITYDANQSVADFESEF